MFPSINRVNSTHSGNSVTSTRGKKAENNLADKINNVNNTHETIKPVPGTLSNDKEYERLDNDGLIAKHTVKNKLKYPLANYSSDVHDYFSFTHTSSHNKNMISTELSSEFIEICKELSEVSDIELLMNFNKEDSSFTRPKYNMERQNDLAATRLPDNSDEEAEVVLAELRTHLQNIISDYLPEFYEFQQTGRNILYHKQIDINALKTRINSMQMPALVQPHQKTLEQAANTFLDQFSLLRQEKDLPDKSLEFVKFRLTVRKAGWDDPQNRNYHETLKHANHLSGYLSETLHLFRLLNDNPERLISWESIRKTSYDVLLNELLPVDTLVHNNQYTANTRGNLAKNHPDNIKFNAIVDSVTMNEMIACKAVRAEIERLSSRLLSGIALTKNHVAKIDGKSETSRIKYDIISLCQILNDIIEDIQPLTDEQLTEPKLPRQKEEYTIAETIKPELKTFLKGVRKKAQGVRATGQTLSTKTYKNAHRIKRTLFNSITPDTNIVNRKKNEAILRIGVILLDKIQQTTSGIHKARLASRSLQQAITLYNDLDRMLSDMKPHRILDERLRTESDRWKIEAEKSEKQLRKTLAGITTLTEEHMKQKFLSVLENELNHASDPHALNSIISAFDIQIKVVIKKLACIEKNLSQTLPRLSEHGEAGSEELDTHITIWLQRLKRIKNKLKTSLTKITGQSINNFSRQGMLARRMGEWSETEKQRFLGSLSAKARPLSVSIPGAGRP